MSSKKRKRNVQVNYLVLYFQVFNVCLVFYMSTKITRLLNSSKKPLREKCLYSEFFWSVFSRIRTEYGEILRTSAYSVQMWENTDQKKLHTWTLFTQCSLLVLIVDPLGLPCFMLGTIWSTQMTKLIS